MKILYATSEARPFVASGGLADVAAALPKALKKKRVSACVVLPLYQTISEELRQSMHFVKSFSVPVAWRVQYCGVFEAKHEGITYYFLDNEYYFKRSNLYGHFDDGERYAFFSRAVLELINYIDYFPDIIHCNDWQTALIPIYLDLFFRDVDRFKNIKTVFTIHNIEFQGKYGDNALEDLFGLPRWVAKTIENDGDVNLMKGAIETADRVTTVSPTYAQEILGPWYSHGLDSILRERQFKLSGIVNGIDTESFNPSTDNCLFANYDAENIKNKAKNKAKLQELLHLPIKSDVPLISMVTRMTEQKGLDLVMHVFEEIISKDVQFVLLGSGDTVFERFFAEMAVKYPLKVSANIGFLPDLSRKIYAGSDIFLMPSKAEPCGLSQMISMRYGTVPVVRNTGGLADTVTDCDDETATGYKFDDYNAHDMLHALERALERKTHPILWNKLVRHCMQSDFSFASSASEYIALYKDILKK